MNLVCPKCELQFAPANLMRSTSGTTNVTFKGVRTNCPRCGADVPFQDGTYSVNESGLFTLLSNPDIPKAALNDLLNLTRRAQAQAYSKEQFVQEIEQLHPLFSFLKNWVIPKDQTAFFALLAILVPMIMQLLSNDDKKTTVINNYNTYVTPPSISAPVPAFKKNSPSAPSVDWNQKATPNTNLTPPKKKRKRPKRH